MNRKEFETAIVLAYNAHTPEKISGIYIDLINLRSKLDRWFTKYIDMFDEKMSTVNTSHPMWKLYNAKFDEYAEINQTIKTAEYYMKKI